MSLPCQKHRFNLDAGIHYLNGAYMSPMMQSVEDAGLRAVLKKRSPNHISPQDFYTDPAHLRSLFAQVVHAASPDEVSLIPAVSYGMAIVAKNLPVEKGQKIVVAAAQFPSNVYPWMRLAADKGLELHIIDMPDDNRQRGRIWNENILSAIDDRTAMVAIGHIHWATGTIFDLKKISEKVHRHGGWLVIDGTQSVGALPMDVQDFQPDALICAGYKWLMGPYSQGYAWFGNAFKTAKPIEENWINRLGSEDFARLVDYQSEYQPGARRFDVGERSNFILVPMAIQALQQLLDWGIHNIQGYCATLTAPFAPKWESLGFSMEEPAGRAAHLFGIQLPAGIRPERLQEKLKEKNVFVSIRGDFIRVAPNVYNDAADMTAFTAVLQTL